MDTTTTFGEGLHFKSADILQPGMDFAGARARASVAANDQPVPPKAGPRKLLSFVLADLVRGLARAERLLDTPRPAATPQ